MPSIHVHVHRRSTRDAAPKYAVGDTVYAGTQTERNLPMEVTEVLSGNRYRVKNPNGPIKIFREEELRSDRRPPRS